MNFLLSFAALGLWFFLTPIVSGLISTILMLPFLNTKNDISGIIINFITAILVCFLGIKAFELLSLNLVYGIPLVMLIAYSLNQRTFKKGSEGYGIMNASILGVVLSALMYYLV